MTLTDIVEMVDAYIKDQTNTQELAYIRTAWLAANIMNSMGTLKRPVTVEILLGKKLSDPEKKTMTAEEQQQRLDELIKKFKK